MKTVIAKAILTFRFEYDEKVEGRLENVKNELADRINEGVIQEHQLDITVVEVNETLLRTDGDRAG